MVEITGTRLDGRDAELLLFSFGTPNGYLMTESSSGLHDFVGAGRSDFHLIARKLMENIRRAPAVKHFACRI